MKVVRVVKIKMTSSTLSKLWSHKTWSITIHYVFIVILMVLSFMLPLSQSLSTKSTTASPSSSSVPSSPPLSSSVDFPSTKATKTMRNSFYQIPNLNRQSYIIPGDISVGAVIEATEKPEKDSAKSCTDEINSSGSWILQYMEALAYAVHLVNWNSTLLPNVTLGLVVLDYCGIPSAALAQALSFVPRQKYGDSFQMCDVNDDPVSTSYPDLDLISSSQEDPHYDVIGVIGPFGSELSLPMSYLYTAVQMPFMSYMATSDELSDTFHHRYFLRVVPPDKYQARAMLQFIQDHGWSYISVLYQEGAYGERGFDNIREMAQSFNICIATSHQMGGLRSDYGHIVSDLLKYSNARVVILFSLDFEVRQVFREVQRRKATGHFIWIGSDGIADRTATFRDFPDVLVGAITFIYNSRPVNDFFEYFGNLTVNSTSNPWFKPFWEAEHKCSFAEGTCDSTKSIDTDGTMKYSHGTSLAIDCILTFAIAVDKMMRDTCPYAQGEEARECIQGQSLLKYLLNTSFHGYTDQIRFDERGDAVGKYQIKQIVLDIPGSNYTTYAGNYSMLNNEMLEVPIGMFEASEGQINYEGRELLWNHLNPATDGIAWSVVDLPESLCSRPCSVGEYKIEKEVPCCWECRRCRDNEKLVDENTRCEACATFSWPDPSKGYTTCIPIPLTYPAFTDTLPIIQVTLAMFSIASTILIFVSYYIFRNERVIKAASRELSFLQLFAILAGYCSVIICQSKPTAGKCGALYFLFCLSFAWLYAPLLVKNIRIYRIFQSGSTNNKQLKCVSPQSQMILSGLLIGIQVLICFVVMAVYKPTVRRNQPIWSEKLVELSCDLTLPGLISFLAYNFVLVLLCSFFAFKTRKLPDNFNESRFIFMCVSTTLVIWLAFVATFFTADRVSVQTLLLSVTLLLNHTVALLFLYLPKIYAVTCL